MLGSASGPRGEEEERMHSQARQGSASSQEERETLWYLGGLRIIQALETQVKQTSKIFEYLVPAKTSVLSYAPDPEDTAFYILQGEATFQSGESTIQATAGTFMFLPRSTGYRYIVPATGSLRLFTWTTPPGFAQRVIRMGNPREAFVLSPPPDLESKKAQQFATLLRAWLGSLQ
jgi:mannose-6-phosphate isomerase-like protein (cupin superfamily)